MLLKVKGLINLLKRRKLEVAICFCLFLSGFILMPTSAAEVNISMTCDNFTPVSGEEFTVNAVLTPDSDTNISAYRIKVWFDSSKLTYKGLYSDIGTDDFRSYVKGDLLTILYVTTEQGFNVKANKSKTLLELNFKVLSGCDVGSTEISAQVDGLCDYDAHEMAIIGIDPITITVTQAGEANCDLVSLSAEGYQLTPTFSSDVTHYTVDVPYSKSTIEFAATPLDETASVKASRKTLKSAGSNTDINLTVSSPDKKSKKVYTITVNRLTKADSELKTLDNVCEEEYDANTLTIDNADFDEENIDNDNNSTQNLSAPLIEKENGFDPIFFTIVACAFIGISMFFIQQKACKHN